MSSTQRVLGGPHEVLIAAKMIPVASPESVRTVTMRVGDYFQQRKRWWLRLHEKGGRTFVGRDGEKSKSDLFA
jgi:hypothetical protein